MAQGQVKKTSNPGATLKAKHAPKKGARVTKPQKAKTKTAADKMRKKYAAGLTAKTEALLSERAGHLEMIGKGKKGSDAKPKQKGGSKKFG